MANLIILKAKAISTLDEYIAFSVALALNDDNKDIPAKFSIDTDSATLPMVGITEYGKMVGLISSSADRGTPIVVTATTGDGTEVEYDGTVEGIINTDVGAEIGGVGGLG